MKPSSIHPVARASLLCTSAMIFACGGIVEDSLELGQTTSAGVMGQGVMGQGVMGQGVMGQGVMGQGVMGQGISITGTEFDGRGMYWHSQRKHGGTLVDGTPLDLVGVIQGELVGIAFLRGDKGEGTSHLGCKVTQYGVTRNCGWTIRNVGKCTPKTEVRVAAQDSLCRGGPSALGSSEGNAMIRVCSGTQGCDYPNKTWLGQNDNACGYEPSVSFTCPYEGTFTVMTGAYASSDNKFSATPAASSLSAVTYPVLKGIYRGPDLKGATLLADEYLPDGTTGVTGFKYRITSVEAETEPLPEGYTTAYPAGTTYLYGLEHQLPDASWVTSCGEDGAAVSAAIPTDGAWDATGAKLHSSTHFTFACTSGVMGKCYRWGYRPWVNASFWDHHQTCTRMARADYCGDGYSWTKDGTTINFSDRMATPVQKMSDDAAYTEDGGFFFEAGWGTSGARCLSHYRWYDLPEGFAADRCQNQLRDPTQPTYNFAWGAYGPTICDTETEAVTRFGTAMHDLSQCNGVEGGCAEITW